jgi:hypothetical protein
MFQIVCYSVHDVPKEVFEHLAGTSVIEMRSNFIVASSPKMIRIDRFCVIGSAASNVTQWKSV